METLISIRLPLLIHFLIHLLISHRRSLVMSSVFCPKTCVSPAHLSRTFLSSLSSSSSSFSSLQGQTTSPTIHLRLKEIAPSFRLTGLIDRLSRLRLVANQERKALKGEERDVSFRSQGPMSFSRSCLSRITLLSSKKKQSHTISPFRSTLLTGRPSVLVTKPLDTVCLPLPLPFLFFDEHLGQDQDQYED